ncbi:MAG: enoyl-CoA hydratase-related protein [Phenylobacterium sp.]|uniref:enoyl-CoA hydratase-related protein n=1 Tax=Phenylobacterium sp. TaxID=1871053 RepID=UPI002736B605|nr:enoyl-CoA hydratase-related protein [Phenylobacterium sp.]MDP3174481.1 enoyl-CoA hydratase-related protein [Phenylobacterium sp.]
MTEHVLIEKAGGVLTLTLNRPEKKNAITAPMYRAIGEAIDGAADDPQVRCVLLLGAGDIFCAGNDLGDFAKVNAGEGEATARADENPMLGALSRARIPLVAAVQGRAVGVGVTMLLHCDLVFIAEDALLTTPFVNLALVPEAASSMLLPQRIGHVRAFSMLVLGEPVDGRTAAAWGLANAAVPVKDLLARATAAAEQIAQRPRAAVGATKALMIDQAAIAAQMNEEAVYFAQQLASAEAKEAFAAFAERRAPDFTRVA